jgi:hypothetical protein
VNGPIKLAVPLLAALAIAACSSGGNSSMPGVTGAGGGPTTQSIRPLDHIPQWQAKGLARAACPQVIGRPVCLALVDRAASGPDVVGWAPAFKLVTTQPPRVFRQPE